MKKNKKLFAVLASAAAVFAAVGLFAACDGEQPTAQCQHQWSEWTEKTPATCESGGKQSRVCELDATHTEERDTDPLGHTYGEWTDDTAATCTAAKTQKRVCSHNADHVDTQTVGEPLGHAMTAEWAYTEPTADKKGAAVKTCTRTGCEEEERVELPALTSTDYSVSTTATCTAAGETRYTVVIEGETFSFTVQTAALGHTPVEQAEVPSTCTSAGTAAYYECSVCHQKFDTEDCENEISEPAALPLAAHTPAAQAEVSSTCMSAGTAAYYECSVCHKKFDTEDCGHEISEPAALPLAGHTPVAQEEVPSTCMSAGTAAYYECSVCHKKFDTEDCTGEIGAPSSLPLAAHVYELTIEEGEEGKLVVAQTCSGCAAVEGETYLVDESVNIDDNTIRENAYLLTRKDYVINAHNPTHSTSAGANRFIAFMIDSVGEYQFTFTPFADSPVRLVDLRLDDTNMINGRTGAILPAYTSFVSVQYEGANNTTNLLSATFTATEEHIGKTVAFSLFCQDDHYTIIKTKMPVFVKNKLVYGDNTVEITETYEWADEYAFVSATEKTYSITVPAGISVAVANKDLDPADFNYLKVILNSSDFMEGEDCYADFTVKANEPVYLVFNSATKGNINVTIGDEIGERIPPILVLDEPFAINFAGTEVVNTLTVGEDVPEGEYLITLKRYSVAANRHYFYFTVNGENQQMLGAGTALNNGNYEDFAVIVTLKAGDVLVFTTSGGTASGKIDVTMTVAPTE